MSENKPSYSQAKVRTKKNIEIERGLFSLNEEEKNFLAKETRPI